MLPLSDIHRAHPRIEQSWQYQLHAHPLCYLINRKSVAVGLISPIAFCPRRRRTFLAKRQAPLEHTRFDMDGHKTKLRSHLLGVVKVSIVDHRQHDARRYRANSRNAVQQLLVFSASPACFLGAGVLFKFKDGLAGA